MIATKPQMKIVKPQHRWQIFKISSVCILHSMINIIVLHSKKKKSKFFVSIKANVVHKNSKRKKSLIQLSVFFQNFMLTKFKCQFQYYDMG